MTEHDTLSAPPSGTVAFLYTDVKDSTRLWQEIPDAMPGSLVQREPHGGCVFQPIGHAICAAFARVPDAPRAAPAAAEALSIES